MGKLVDFLAKCGHRRHGLGVRTAAVVCGGLFFVAGWPLLLVAADRFFGAPHGFLPVFMARLFSCLGFAAGIPWMGWAVFWQLSRGRGTPVPVVPPTEFLPTGPYRYVRNPMIMGFLLYLGGWTFLFNSAAAFVSAGAIGLLLVLEIKLIEEKELEARFGDTYRNYKKQTPFFLPRLKR